MQVKTARIWQTIYTDVGSAGEADPLQSSNLSVRHFLNLKCIAFLLLIFWFEGIAGSAQALKPVLLRSNPLSHLLEPYKYFSFLPFLLFFSLPFLSFFLSLSPFLPLTNFLSSFEARVLVPHLDVLILWDQESILEVLRDHMCCWGMNWLVTCIIIY